MAIKDEKLKQFFSKQKVGAFDALLHKGKVVSKTEGINKEIRPISNTDFKIQAVDENPLQIESRDESIKSVNQKPELLSTENTMREESIEQVSSVSNPLAFREHSDSNSLPIRKHTVSIPLPNPLATPLANFDKNELVNLHLFSKKERELITYIFSKCQKQGSLISPPISSEEFFTQLNVSAERLRNLIFRIIKKNGLKVSQHKSGQNAYRIFELSKGLYQSILDAYSLSHPLATSLANPLASPSLSSSNIKTTTEMPNEWKKIDCAPLKKINFSIVELKNIHRKCPDYIDAGTVQNSIYQFAFGLDHNPDRYKNMTAPCGILVKTLCEGIPWIEDGYVSPEEQLRIEKENKATKFIEQQFKEPQFLSWFHSLTDDEKENLVPTGLKDSAGYPISKTVIQKEEAYKKFEYAIWPNILKDIKDNLQ